MNRMGEGGKRVRKGIEGEVWERMIDVMVVWGFGVKDGGC